MLESLDAPAIRRWCELFTAALDRHRTLLDALNVFPVPDGDTGTNLLHTARAATDAAAPEQSQAGDALRAIAHGAVLGARGNSGVIVSQVLRGLAEQPADADRLDGRWLQRALKEATDLAYAAVEQPVEGTILTVLHAAADAAQDVLETPPSLDAVVAAALSGATAALHRTPELLAELAQAGVVDAGGQGLVLILEALAQTVDSSGPPGQVAAATAAQDSASEADSRDFGYEVQYLLDAPARAIARLRGDLARIGNSLVVVGTGQGVWNVHVHVHDVGAALEAGVRAGRPYRITVARFDEDMPAPRQQPRAGAEAGSGVSVVVVAVAPGHGLAHLFEAEGVLVVEGTGGNPPDAADVLAAMRSAGTERVVLLPNAAQITGVAKAAAEQARAQGLDVAVVPAKSPVQGLAAIAVHDPQRLFGDDVVAMAEAAAATRWAEVTIATQEALTSAGRCQAGDVLGLIDGEVVQISATVSLVALGILDRLLGVGGEIVTIVLGLQAEPGLGEALRSHVDRQAPGTEVTVIDGGQSGAPLLIGVE